MFRTRKRRLRGRRSAQRVRSEEGQIWREERVGGVLLLQGVGKSVFEGSFVL
jgi:hypothetical protein